MKQSVLRFAAQLWAMLAVLLLFVAAALPAHADDGGNKQQQNGQHSPQLRGKA